MEGAGDPRSIKQVIVIRRDLGMRRGKEIAQGSHASMAFLSNAVRKSLNSFADDAPLDLTGPQEAWLEGSFTKVVCQVANEEELEKVYYAAKRAQLEVHLITDSGKTEFEGVPTETALAIGPDYSDLIDPVTKDLRLY